MIHLNLGHNANLSAIQTQVDISTIPPDQIQGLLRSILSAHPDHAITLKHKTIPLASFTVDQLSSSRELGLVYHVTVHADRKGKPAATFFDPRTELPVGNDPSYLPSGAWCSVKKNISGVHFRLPFLGDVERGLQRASGLTSACTILSDAERTNHLVESSKHMHCYAQLGIGKGKSLNEDAVVISELKDSSKLLAVVDGIGGRGAGLLAARSVASALSSNVLCSKSFRDIESLLPQHFGNTFTDVNDRYPLLTSPHMGAALAAARIGRSYFECARGGDCRIAHFRAFRNRTRCIWASEDQCSSTSKPTNIMRLERGIAQPIELTIVRHKIERGDTVILGSDGFWRALTNKEIERCLHQKSSVLSTGVYFEQTIHERMQSQRRLRDNFSFVIYRH
jgi:serine/threonine protein phosphatase PrpC